MNYYEEKQQAAYTNWQQAIDNGDTEKVIAERMTEHSNYCKFVEQPELQARVK